MKFKGIIYCYESPSGKFYIGQTTRTANKRKDEHKSRARLGKGYLFHNAIRKYGFEAFKYQELATITESSKERLKKQLNSLERYYISMYKSEGKVLYNLSDGGDTICDNTGRKLSDEHKRKIGMSLKGIIFSEERKRNISKGRKKPIVQLSLDGNFIKEWESASDVPFARRNSICACLTRTNKTCAGFIWKYKKDYEQHIPCNRSAGAV